MEVPSLSSGLRKGAWTKEEDILLKKCIENYGEGKWHTVPSRAGLNRCRKSCRLRWLNYLKPSIKRGDFDEDEIDLIVRLHNLLGNRWSLIAGRIPGRTANDVKNYWNTHLLKKKLNPTKNHLNPKSSLSKPNIKVIKPRPWNLSKNTNFPLSNNVNGAAAIRASDNSVPVDGRGNDSNNSFCFPDCNDETILWGNVLMNDEQQDNSVNNINVSGPINEESGIRSKVVEEGNYGNLDELFLDADLWNVFNP